MNSTSPVIHLDGSRPPAADVAPVSALLSIGFRPFFFAASLAAVFLIPAWLLTLSGHSSSTYWSTLSWHAHEMIFGYTVAVITGFLLTAGANWTKTPVAQGRPLLALLLLWGAGRVLPFLTEIPPLVVAVIDIAFLPATGFVLGRALFVTKNLRNYFFLLLLALLTGANVLFHLEQLGASVPVGLGRDLALRTIAFMILVMGGRVFPMFTRNATGGSPTIRNVLWLDRLALGAFLVASICQFAGVPSTLGGALWILTGVAHVARMTTWGVAKARAPLLWILHAGYFATALSFVLQGAFLWGVVPFASALHCFTVGGIGLLTLGMMARVSLGHSGRMLVAPRSIALSFLLLTLAALVRVLVPLAFPSYLPLSWQVSGVLWTLAFAIFLRVGAPIWSQPRLN